MSDNECVGIKWNQLTECKGCKAFRSCRKEYNKKSRVCKSPKCDNRFIPSYGNERYCEKCREEAKMTFKKKEVKKDNNTELSFYMELTEQRDMIRSFIKEKREAESKVKSNGQKIKTGYKDMLNLIDNMEKERERNKKSDRGKNKKELGIKVV